VIARALEDTDLTRSARDMARLLARQDGTEAVAEDIERMECPRHRAERTDT